MRDISILSLNAKNQESGFGLAYKLACERLAEITDIEQQCLKSGASLKVVNSEKVISLEYLNQPYQIALPDGKISVEGSDEEVPLRDKILILHYLTQAKGTPLSNKAIAYQELPEGANYFPTFTKRAIKPLTDHFGNEPHQLLLVAERLGGHKAEYGDAAVTINAFSRVPITLVLWRGDAELPPAGNILFDSNITDYLSVEDINVLCETIAWRLVRLLRTGGDNHHRR